MVSVIERFHCIWKRKNYQKQGRHPGFIHHVSVHEVDIGGGANMYELNMKAGFLQVILTMLMSEVQSYGGVLILFLQLGPSV